MSRSTRLTCAIILALSSLRCYAQINMCLEKMPASSVPHGTESYVFEQDLKWDNGAIINVKFMNGNSFLREKVIKYAKMWEEYANIHFNFDQDSRPGILIEFSNDRAAWSNVGRLSRASAMAGEPSMHYGWFDDNTDETNFRRTILHEFGHALGLRHEHQCADNTIKWNKAVAYNYFFEQNGWTPEQVDRQVFNRFSVTLSNGTYDRASIMHYPIPDEITLDGKGVPWNTQLSAGDISIISEKYPRIKAPVTGTGAANVEKPAAVINNIETTHNYLNNGQKGIRVVASFNIQHAAGKNCIAGLYFYTADNKPIPGLEPAYQTFQGNAAVMEQFTPTHSNSGYTKFELFIPYKQLKVDDGESKLKFLFVLWDGPHNEIARSAYTSFTLRRGPICNKIDLVTRLEDDNQRMFVIPKFTVENAQQLQCTATVYFCDAAGNFLENSDGSIVTYSTTFNPSYEAAAYNSGYYSDLYLNVPYDDLHPFISGETEIRYFVRLLYNDKEFAESDWGTVTFGAP